MGPGCRRLPADNGVPEGGLADGGRGAFLSRSRRQEAQAGELVSQSHPEKTHSKHTEALTLPGRVAAVARKMRSCQRSPVFVVYDGINERVVDGRGLRYDGRDGLRVRRQDVGVPGRGTNRSKELKSCVCFQF